MDEKNLNNHLMKYIAEQYLQNDEEQKQLKQLCLDMHADHINKLMWYNATIMSQEYVIKEQAKVIKNLQQMRKQKRKKPY